MNVHGSRLILLAGLVLVLSACSGAPTLPTTVEAPGMPNAELALQRSMAQVNADVGTLGSFQPPSVRAGAPPVLPSELQKPITFTWSGPLDAGVRKVADAIGYQVEVYVPPDHRPLSVAVSVSGQAVDVLRALGEQSGTLATVSVDPQHHEITVTHHV